MNYLSHFVYNHDVSGLPAQPYFALGVVLPDLWLRFSRRRRIRWKAVQAAAPVDADGVALRAGLLNHVELDRRFHSLALFLNWQREILPAVRQPGVHPAVAEFLAHMAIELALDQRLLHATPRLAERFYDVIAACDAEHAARRTGELGAVDTTGLGAIISSFAQRRFLRRYVTLAGLVETVQLVLSFAQIPAPPLRPVEDLLRRAVAVSEPQAVWAALAGEVGAPASADPAAAPRAEAPRLVSDFNR